MKRIVRLTEQDLVRLVNRVISEQSNPVAQTGYVRNPRGYTKPTQNNTQFVSCSSLGIKSPGYCDSKTKRPVAPCSQFGVKTPGYCFMDNKQPVPNSGVVKEQLVSEQTNQYPEDDPIQKPFYEYVSDRWGVGVTGVEIDFDQNGNQKVCDGPCKSIIPGTDENAIIWDYKKGVVLGLKSFGVDPKPISIKTNFQQMKQWFDNTFGRSS
jgi:hypothetical protein